MINTKDVQVLANAVEILAKISTEQPNNNPTEKELAECARRMLTALDGNDCNVVQPLVFKALGLHSVYWN